MKLEDLNGKKILILGYGKEGKATERFLKKIYPGLECGIADKSISSDYLKEQHSFDLAIKTPGIPKDYLSIPYTTATNLFFANKKNMTIGITGTKGKSTTASLIFSILKEAGLETYLLGNIGQPMIEALDWSVGKEAVFVCELSSYQLDDINYSPHISVVLDLFPDHMNYHGGVDRYYRAKKNIIGYQKADDYFIYNPAYDILARWSKDCVSKAVPFTSSLPLADSEIPLVGSFNRDNVCAAVTVGRILKVKEEVMASAVKKFKALPHRLQPVGEFQGIRFYDDAISTTPESTIFAIKTLGSVGTIFLGGEDRGYEFNNLIDTLIKYKVANIVFFPESGKKMRAVLRSTSKEKSFNILETISMEQAVDFAYEHTPKNTICLLSTASPSYSLWKNFEEKGDQFQFYIRQHEKKT